MIFRTSLQERFLLKKKSVILNWRWQFIWNSLWVYLVQEKILQNKMVHLPFDLGITFQYIIGFFCVSVWCKKLCNCHYFLLFVLHYSKSGRTDETCLSNFLLFVNLDECGSIRTHWRNVMWQIFYFSLKFYVLYMKQ